MVPTPLPVFGGHRLSSDCNRAFKIHPRCPPLYLVSRATYGYHRQALDVRAVLGLSRACEHRTYLVYLSRGLGLSSFYCWSRASYTTSPPLGEYRPVVGMGRIEKGGGGMRYGWERRINAQKRKAGITASLAWELRYYLTYAAYVSGSGCLACLSQLTAVR